MRIYYLSNDPTMKMFRFQISDHTETTAAAIQLTTYVAIVYNITCHAKRNTAMLSYTERNTHAEGTYVDCEVS